MGGSPVSQQILATNNDLVRDPRYALLEEDPSLPAYGNLAGDQEKARAAVLARLAREQAQEGAPEALPASSAAPVSQELGGPVEAAAKPRTAPLSQDNEEVEGDA